MKKFDRKGQIRIIEALLAVSLMFSVLALGAPPPRTPDFERQETLKMLGMQVLIELDKNGTLGELIDDGNWTTVKRSISILLPLGVFFNLTVYNEQSQEVNSQAISNSNLSNMQWRDTASVQYLCATQGLDVRLYKIRLQLAWAE